MKWEGFSIEHNFWEPWDHVHAPELVVDFYHKHPGAAHHIQTIDFHSLSSRPLHSLVVLGCHSLEGGWMSGDTLNTLASLPSILLHFQVLPLVQSIYHLIAVTVTNYTWMEPIRYQWPSTSPFGYISLFLSFSTLLYFITKLYIVELPLVQGFHPFLLGSPASPCTECQPQLCWNYASVPCLFFIFFFSSYLLPWSLFWSIT